MTVYFWKHFSEVDYDWWKDHVKNFSPQELACKGTGEIKIAWEALQALEALREACGHPLRIVSAYRSALHNARVGGAPRSRHKVGDAFDIALQGVDRRRLLELARRVGFTGIGYGKTFLHVDMGPRREWDYTKDAKEAWGR